MRNISYALNKADDFIERLSILLGFNVDPDSVHNGSVISYIAEIAADPELFDLAKFTIPHPNDHPHK